MCRLAPARSFRRGLARCGRRSTDDRLRGSVMTEHVLIERRGAVQVIRINRPDKKNALTRAMYGTMATALRAGDADPEIRCHAILGVPGSFSSGNDMGDFMVIASGGKGGEEVFHFLTALAELEKPLVSGVDGIAVGI